MLYWAQGAINTASEQRAFVFGVTFILIFGVLVNTIPAGLQGPEESPEMVTPLNPNIVTGFSETENYTESAFSYTSYVYDMGGKTWIAQSIGTSLYLGSKVLIGGWLWFGTIDACIFISEESIDRDVSVSFTEIDLDAVDGIARYTLVFQGSGVSGGVFIAYWNTTLYDNSTAAWNNDELFLLHGIGIDATAQADVGSLLIGLLFLQIPEVPVLVNIFLVGPIWASILFTLWYVIKEMIPFL